MTMLATSPTNEVISLGSVTSLSGGLLLVETGLLLVEAWLLLVVAGLLLVKVGLLLVLLLMLVPISLWWWLVCCRGSLMSGVTCSLLWWLVSLAFFLHGPDVSGKLFYHGLQLRHLAVLNSGFTRD
jgi:hypothetical protein